MTTFARSVLVAEWNGHPVRMHDSYSWENDGKADETTEEHYLSQPRLLFCKCGVESEGIVSRVSRRNRPAVKRYQVTNANGMSPSVHQPEVVELSERPAYPTPYVFGVTFACPECGAEPDIIMGWKEPSATRRLNFIKLYDDREQEPDKPIISLVFGISSYFFNNKVNKMSIKVTRLRISHNIRTGMTYAIEMPRRMIRNISYGNLPSWVSDHMIQNIDTDILVSQFARLIVETRLQWMSPDDVFADPNGQTQSPFTQLYKATMLAALPQLQNLPFKNYSIGDAKDRRKIRQAGNNGKNLWELFAGNSSKKVRTLIKDESTLHIFRNFLPIFKDMNNLLKLIESHDDANARHYSQPITALYREEETVYHGNRHAQLCYQYMISLHKDETHFTNTLLKLQRPTYGISVERRFNLEHAWGVAMDCCRMTESILRRDLNYTIDYRNDIHEFHERLSRDLSRYTDPLAAIPYSEEESSIYNRQVKNYRFVLAESNHELARVGSDQKICVGGYGGRAIRKECVIVLAYNENDELEMTLELNPMRESSRGIVLSQAKLSRNGIPSTEQANIVAEWCYETNTIWDNCYDMQNASGMDAEEWFARIPGGEPPTWAVHSSKEEQRQTFNLLQNVYDAMGLTYQLTEADYIPADYIPALPLPF